MKANHNQPSPLDWGKQRVLQCILLKGSVSSPCLWILDPEHFMFCHSHRLANIKERKKVRSARTKDYQERVRVSDLSLSFLFSMGQRLLHPLL